MRGVCVYVCQLKLKAKGTHPAMREDVKTETDLTKVREQLIASHIAASASAAAAGVADEQVSLWSGKFHFDASLSCVTVFCSARSYTRLLLRDVVVL